MKNLDALIRLARFKVDGLQTQMAALDEARAQLERQFERLSASVPEEQVAATAMKDGFVAYGSYAQAVIVRKTNLRGSIGEVDAQADTLRAQLQAALAELKKYELLDERQRGQARAAQAKREQAELDDIAGMRRAAAG